MGGADGRFASGTAQRYPNNKRSGERLKQPALGKQDMRYHVTAHPSHRKQQWEAPSASLIEKDPEENPDMNIAAKFGKDFFLDEKIPRHESDQDM